MPTVPGNSFSPDCEIRDDAIKSAEGRDAAKSMVQETATAGSGTLGKNTVSKEP
jgi:hypothetical protein